MSNSNSVRPNPMQVVGNTAQAEGYVNPRDIAPAFYANVDFMSDDGTTSMGKVGDRGLAVKPTSNLNKELIRLLQEDPQLAESESEIRNKIVARMRITIGMNVGGREIEITL
jgi:hypothetical protein